MGLSSQQNTGSNPTAITSAQTIDSTVWMEVAANAWAYFQVNVGVDPNTGLPYAGGLTFTGFTDWDLGAYIQAIIDAQKMNLIPIDGPWGSYSRINMVLTFLKNRPLNNAGYPYQFYDAKTGQDDSAFSSGETVDITDTGRLFVALNNLRAYDSSFNDSINTIVYGRSNYTALAPGIISDSANSTNIYSYYIYSGFASFFPMLLIVRVQY